MTYVEYADRPSMGFRLPISTLKSNGGFIIGALASAAVLTVVFFVAIQMLSPLRNTQAVTQELLVAELYAAELLEHFVSLSSDELQIALSTDATLKLLPLCSYINIANSTDSGVINAIPMASLPAPNPLDSPKGVANRYFKIEIVDVTTLIVRADVCTKLPNQIRLSGRTGVAGDLLLNATDTFKITVGVVWQSKSGKTTDSAKRVEISSTSLNL